MPYEFLDHTADAGLSLTGRSLAELFESAGAGLAALLCSPDQVAEQASLEISADAPDLESLLVEWLSSINFRFEVDHFAFSSFTVRELSEHHVAGTGSGEPIDLTRHRLGAQVKAVTYHRLGIRQEGGLWLATVIVDI